MGYTTRPVFKGAEGNPNAYIDGPDGLKVEVQQDDTLTGPPTPNHVHYMVKDNAGQACIILHHIMHVIWRGRPSKSVVLLNFDFQTVRPIDIGVGVTLGAFEHRTGGVSH